MNGFIYKSPFIIALICVILAIPLTYSVFVWKPIISLPVGENLKVENWLSFWGSFLSFSGTVFLGTIAYTLNRDSVRISERLLRLEESIRRPNIIIDGDTVELSPFNPKIIREYLSAMSFSYPNKNYELVLKIKNISNEYITGIDLVSLKIDGVLSDESDVPLFHSEDRVLGSKAKLAPDTLKNCRICFNIPQELDNELSINIQITFLILAISSQEHWDQTLNLVLIRDPDSTQYFILDYLNVNSDNENAINSVFAELMSK